MQNLRVTMLQSDIAWEDKMANLQHYRALIEPIAKETDLVVLPEMFTTGFSMNSRELSETNDGTTLETLKGWAVCYDIALTGSFMAKEGDEEGYYNRAFFVTPEGEAHFYDKKHLFRMGDEANHFTAGESRTIVPYKGWNVCLMVCYDLRFPVWSRNCDNEYDLLIYCANWPHSRINAWDTLLAARAIENAAYVCGVNRIGTDATTLNYTGHSAVYDFKGRQVVAALDNQTVALTTELDGVLLKSFRQKFPIWKDADRFELL